MSAFDSDADRTSQLAPRPWFDLADPPSVRPSWPGGPLGDDTVILDRWRRALIARDDAEVDRLVRLSRSERARMESTTFDDHVLGAQQRSERNDRVRRASAVTGDLGVLAVSALSATPRHEGVTWSPIRRGDTETLRRVFAAHGCAAFRVAMAITGESAAAGDAVTSAFMALTVERTTSRRSMRIEVLDATWLAAVDRVDAVRSRRTTDRLWHSLYDGLSTDQRNVLVLSIPGESSCLEIAQMLGMDRDAVHHNLWGALDVAAREVATAPVAGSGTGSSEPA